MLRVVVRGDYGSGQHLHAATPPTGLLCSRFSGVDPAPHLTAHFSAFYIIRGQNKMEWSETFKEDLVSNLLLGIGMVLYFAGRDLCKRIAHSDCQYDANEGGLKIRLPTWRTDADADEKDNEV